MVISKMPAQVKTVLRTLEEAGFAAYLVGGCVRDSLMGRTPADWDVATAARPDDVRQAIGAFRVVEIGRASCRERVLRLV